MDLSFQKRLWNKLDWTLCSLNQTEKNGREPFLDSTVPAHTEAEGHAETSPGEKMKTEAREKKYLEVQRETKLTEY